MIDLFCVIVSRSQLKSPRKLLLAKKAFDQKV